MSPSLAIAIGIWLIVNSGFLYDVCLMDDREEWAQFIALLDLLFGVVLLGVGVVGMLA